MLFFRDGFVYDTVDGSKQKVSDDILRNVLALGVNI